jgi:predicted nucleotidyltransferase
MGLQAMKEAIAEYFKTQPVLKAWLFGSYARGEATPESDLDILFVPDRTNFAAKSKETIIMRKSTLILAFLAAVACARAQSADFVLRRNFETETDSILYEMSVAEGAEDIYRVEDTEYYYDSDGAIVDWFCEPEYEGGPDSIKAFVERNLCKPPGYEDWSGTVLVEFVVETDGTMTNPKVKVSLDPVLDAEAVKVVMSLPNKWIWDPERCYGAEVKRCFYNIPVSFSR